MWMTAIGLNKKLPTNVKSTSWQGKLIRYHIIFVKIDSVEGLLITLL
jgi:hypothetical protein